MYTEQQVSQVLHAIGLDIERTSESDWIVFCPYHNNYNTPAGEVSKKRGTFFCFSCGEIATLEKLVMKVSGRTYFETMRLIKANEVESDLVDDIIKSLATKPVYDPFDEEMIKRLHRNCLESDRAQKYWASRNIHPRSIYKFELGYSENYDMVTVPVHSPEGMCVGFQARSIEGKQFKNTHMPTSRLLFNLHRVKNKSQVVVIESPFDAILLDQIEIPAVASMGAGISTGRIELLDKYFPHVILIPDAGEAGENMKKKLSRALGSKLTVINLPAGVKDVGELSRERLEILSKTLDNPLVAMI